MARGENVVVTHTTFLNANDETMQLIREGDYVLVIDEEVEVVRDFNSIQTTVDDRRQQVSQADIERLIRRQMIAIGSDFKVSWTDEDQPPDGKDYEVMRIAKLGRLYCARGKLLVTIYPPEIFSLFDNVFVLTYIFNGSTLDYYFQLFGLKYEMSSVQKSEDGYTIAEYSHDADLAFRKQFGELVHLCDKSSLNRRRMLSKTWFGNAKPDELKQLRNDIRTFFLGCPGLETQHAMWTCPADYEKKIAPQGFTRIRQLTATEKRLPKEKRDEIKSKTKCFVPSNSKATNIYRDRWALAYCFNLFRNPMISGFFEDSGIQIDGNLFSVSCLVQWICRSRIRDGLPIELYLPSSRMRDLLTDWMDVA